VTAAEVGPEVAGVEEVEEVGLRLQAEVEVVGLRLRAEAEVVAGNRRLPVEVMELRRRNGAVRSGAAPRLDSVVPRGVDHPRSRRTRASRRPR
jgi:hypothetical protein